MVHLEHQLERYAFAGRQRQPSRHATSGHSFLSQFAPDSTYREAQLLSQAARGS